MPIAESVQPAHLLRAYVVRARLVLLETACLLCAVLAPGHVAGVPRNADVVTRHRSQ